MTRGDNCLSTIRRSVEAGTTINWNLMGTQLTQLFYQTFQDGMNSGQQLHQFKRQENEMMQSALDRLLEMGAALGRQKKATNKVEALEDLEVELLSCFREVVIDSLDLSGKKLDRLMDKFTKALCLLTEDVKAQAAIEEEE